MASAPIKMNVRIDGLKEIESRLKVLREEFGVKTGGVIIRGLRAGAKLIQQDAKRRAPAIDPSGFIQARVARLAAEDARRMGVRKGVRGRGTLRKSLAMIRSNIVEHAIKTTDPRANGQPTVLVRVRNRGYTRGSDGSIRFNNPSSSPGYWWWVEFGTSRFPARPFLRPAFEAQKLNALTEFRKHVSGEIEKLFAKNSAVYAPGRWRGWTVAT